MSATNEEEARAEAWLRGQGYIVSRPTWLPPGQNPDFWAEKVSLAPPHLWIEVKSIAPNDSTAAMDRFSNLIGAARIPQGLHGRAMLNLEPHAIEQSIRWVIKSFTTRSAAFAGQKVSLIFLQQTRNCAEEYRVDIDAETPIAVWARANDLPLNRSTWLRDDTVYATARVRAPNGSEITGPAYQFFERQYPMECALVVRLDPQDKVLESISYMCGGGGQTRERTIGALSTANGQIKTACSIRDAPGLVILTPQGRFADNDEMMQAAIYGQYTVPLRLIGNHVEQGDLYHGLSGVFRHNKNTHISAAVHVRREGPATFFPNPYARHPIPDDAPVFAGAVRAKVEFVQSQS